MLSNRSMPRAAVIPVLAYPDVAEAVDWLCRTFGFTLRIRIGDHRAQLNVGDDGGAVVVTAPAGAKASVMVRVENVDAHHERCLQSGARIVEPPSTYPYGERQYTVEDPAGHQWKFSESVADIDPLDWGGSLS